MPRADLRGKKCVQSVVGFKRQKVVVMPELVGKKVFFYSITRGHLRVNMCSCSQ
jgi:hypothetical protein